eukprot:TRINITY_DN27873_c0_g1_i1.p1 TRINITY_DN27873_c0_g1~~TRINITY_DN27873_c0_g1_i1.p1  ORF type:complete len:129 (+),score=10.36 TRINITY_DN27873_c0_g1_i1:261-647(+)
MNIELPTQFRSYLLMKGSCDDGHSLEPYHLHGMSWMTQHQVCSFPFPTGSGRCLLGGNLILSSTISGRSSSPFYEYCIRPDLYGGAITCVSIHHSSSRHPLSLSLIHISEPTRLLSISYAVFCLKKKK